MSNQLDHQVKTFILASMSPRRKELLAYLGIPFEQKPSNCDETPTIRRPREMVQELAHRKADFIARELSKEGRRNLLVVGSDTTVSINNTILEKPADNNEAKKMLKLLSGKTHQVYTGVSLIHVSEEGHCDEVFNFCEKTDVLFDHLTDTTLDSYLRSEHVLDKAGAYGIQGMALSFISGINGCFASVMGFPLARFKKELFTYLEENQFQLSHKS